MIVYERIASCRRLGLSGSFENRRGDTFMTAMIALGFVGLIGMGYGALRQRNIRMEPPSSGSYLPEKDGVQLLAVYIGSSTCHGSKLAGFPETEKRTMAALSNYAHANGMSFLRVGASIDNSPTVGRKYLAGLGDFEIVSVGGGWLNPEAVKYLWRDFPAKGTIPQIVVIKRNVYAAKRGATMGPDSLLGRLVGMDGMAQWLATQRAAASQ
jgi:hypothetical protein